MNTSLSVENQKTYNYLLGIAIGLEKAGDYMLDKCSQKYRDGYDEDAGVFRDIGEDFKAQSVQKRIELEEWENEVLAR